MEAEVKYSGLEDRQAKVAEYEAKGLRMLQDNFDNPAWKHGDPMVGTMTFTDIMPEIVPVEPVRDPLAEIDEIKARLNKISPVSPI